MNRLLGRLLLVLLAVPLAMNLSPAHATDLVSGDWPTYLGSITRDGFNSAETIINPHNVASLHLVWKDYNTHLYPTISAQPVVGLGHVYWSSWDGYMHSNLLTGRRVWSRFLGQTFAPQCTPKVEGVSATPALTTAVIRGKTTHLLLAPGGRPTFYALNADTGQIIWSTNLGVPAFDFLWSSPAVLNGHIYEGVSSIGSCPNTQAKVVEMDAATGAIVHTFSLVPDGCTGAGVWGSPTIDATAGLVYVATGDAGSCDQPEPYATAILALRTSDLSLADYWSVPANALIPDGDFGSTPVLFASGSTPLVGVVNKNGIFYAFDRSSLQSGPVWMTQIANAGECPQCGGGPIAPAAWDGTHLFVAGTQTAVQGKTCNGSVSALDPADGSALWTDCLNGLVLGAVTAVAGLLEVGAGGHMIVLSASTGQILFQYSVTLGDSIYAPATIAHGLLLQGTLGGTLYALTPTHR